MPIKFFEELKNKSKIKKELQGQESNKKSHDGTNEKENKVIGKGKEERKFKYTKKEKKPRDTKKERKSLKISKREPEQQPTTSNAKPEAAHLIAADDVCFIEEDRPKENEYGNPDPISLTVNPNQVEYFNSNLAMEYANPDLEPGYLKGIEKIDKAVSDEVSPNFVEQEVDVNVEEISEIIKASPVPGCLMYELQSKITPPSDQECKQTEPSVLLRPKPLTKFMENIEPSEKALLQTNDFTLKDTQEDTSKENFAIGKTPTGSAFSSAILPPSSPPDDVKSSYQNEYMRDSRPPDLPNTSSLPQNKLASLIKISNQNQNLASQPTVGILKTNTSNNHIPLSAQSIENSSLKKTYVDSSKHNVSSTNSKLVNVDDNTNNFRKIKELWEQKDNVNPYVKNDQAKTNSAISNVASGSRSIKNGEPVSPPIASSLAKVEPVSKQYNNEKSRPESNTESSEDFDESSTSSSSSSYSSSTSSSPSSSYSDSDSSTTSCSSDTDSSSSTLDSDATNSSSSSNSSSTSASEIGAKGSNAIVRKNIHSKPQKAREERF